MTTASAKKTSSEAKPESAADDAGVGVPEGSRLDRLPGFGRPTARFVHRWAIALLVANVGIVVTGGAVRLTQSGLGCPTWPTCTTDSVTPHPALGIHGAIEFGNRMLTWVLVVIAIAAWLAVWRQKGSRSADRKLVVALALGIPFQGIIGGITVLTDLNPWVVALHFLLSMVIVSGATVLVYRTRPYPGVPPTAPELAATSGATTRLGRWLAWLTYLATWAAIYLGTVVTGSGPHAGDADAPRNGLSPVSATQLHADSVFILIGLSLALIVFTRVLGLTQQRAALIFGATLVLQGIIGAVQYATDLPILLVLAHMLGSGLMLIGATWLILDFTPGIRDAQDRDAV